MFSFHCDICFLFTFNDNDFDVHKLINNKSAPNSGVKKCIALLINLRYGRTFPLPPLLSLPNLLQCHNIPQNVITTKMKFSIFNHTFSRFN